MLAQLRHTSVDDQVRQQASESRRIDGGHADAVVSQARLTQHFDV
jgi:hypothetical protein